MGFLDSFFRIAGDNLGAGDEINRQFNAEQAEIQRQFNSAEAIKQRDWETEMSNTAYQRQVADMKAAGLNPAAMYTNNAGGGASTPSGAAATGPAAYTNSNGSNVFVGLISSAVSLALGLKAGPLQNKAVNTATKLIKNIYFTTKNQNYFVSDK